MRRFKCTIQYDGTDYSGYQVQPNGLTIQEVLEKTLARMHKHPVKVIGSGRTDARVHAQGQVIHFDTELVDCTGKHGEGLKYVITGRYSCSGL